MKDIKQTRIGDLTVKQLLDSCPISQIALADRIGVHRNTVTNWRKGRTQPDVTQYLKLLSLFDETIAR